MVIVKYFLKDGYEEMESIRIKNVKSLMDTNEVFLSPITLLVGKNSSGKSTFLRTFPLIKQSIRKRTDGPLLWAGDVDDYVDFGSFLETVTDNELDDHPIEFQFNFKLSLSRNRYYLEFLKNALENVRSYDVRYGISIAKAGSKEYISRLSVNFCNSDFVFEMQPNPRDVNVVVDGIPLLQKKMFKNKIITPFDDERKSVFGFKLPPIEMFLDLIVKSSYENEMENLNITLENFGMYDLFLPFTSGEIAMQIIGECLCKGVPLSIFDNNLSDEDKKENSKFIGNILKIATQLNNSNGELKEHMIAILKLVYFYGCFSVMDRYIANYFNQVHYIAPVRATAERYYRLRNVSIDEVDYQGKNLAIFLESLSKSDKLLNFNQWTDSLLGFHVGTKNDGEHISIQVASRGKEKATNLLDTGFGFSQILPIVTQLWQIVTEKAGANTQRKHSWNIPSLVLAVEQPELHLHPALQGNLAESFVSSIELAKKNNFRLQLILETHSETMVNYFGKAVAEGKISSEDVSVVLFDKDENNLTRVHSSGYDKDGYLFDWPIGFFSAGS